MKKIFLIFYAVIWSVFFSLAISAQDFRKVQDGVEYAEMTRQIENQPVRINLLRLDLTKVRLDVVHAMDAAIGTETTSSIAARHGAVAAINAGFFRLDRSIFAGDATGILKIDGKVLSESVNNRIALFINNEAGQTKVDFLYLNLGALISIEKQNFAVSGINRQRNENEMILYTPEFHRTTLTDRNGVEIIVKKGKIKSIIDGKGSAPIPSDGFVLSATGKMREKILPSLKMGAKAIWDHSINGTPETMPISVESAINPFIQSEDIISGVPQLIKNGKIEITWEREKSSKAFVETRHPRTAVARLKDGKFLMVTVDGRQEHSAGINLPNLAQILLELGATDAMNLDGGGSTTMFLDGKVVNKPSDKEGERKVSDAILVFPRKK